MVLPAFIRVKEGPSCCGKLEFEDQIGKSVLGHRNVNIILRLSILKKGK